jgi:hypothetical protein
MLPRTADTIPKGDFTMTNQFNLGQVVRNFGILAKVVGFHEITGEPELRELWNTGGGTWHANPELCEPVGEQREVLRHKDGLVALG